MMNIILIAPPAAGKGTQSKLISQRYNIPHISTGDLLRDETSSGSEAGKKLKAIMDSGALIPDDKIVNLLRTRISKVDCNNGYVLDGYPRNVDQALIYDDLLLDSRKKVGVVIYLDILFRRYCRMDTKTKKIVRIVCFVLAAMMVVPSVIALIMY